MKTIQYHSVIEGSAAGEMLVSNTGLSFWGGVNPENGEIIDQHHPLKGQSINGKVLAIPSGRGSSSGSGVVLELLKNDVAPAAIIFMETEDIITLGVLVSDVMFDRSIPICRIDKKDFKQLESGSSVKIQNGILCTTDNAQTQPQNANSNTTKNDKDITTDDAESGLALSASDKKLLNGEHGKAAELAMQIVVRMANIQGATELVDVSQAHIDACVYNGPSSLQFAQKLASLGGKVRVPTTLNSLSVDTRRWKNQGVNESFGTPASQLGEAYRTIGAQPTYTCAPYLLGTAPEFGQQIVWAESNAVTYANSVIGARTQKYPDFLDACIALTARAPAIGAHLDSGRLPSLKIQINGIDKKRIDDAFWPLLGYHVGAIAKNDIPIVFGLEDFTVTSDNHKAFSAAFATTSSVPMYHINAITPEANAAANTLSKTINTIQVGHKDLMESWEELNSANAETVDMVCLGNPHFSATEIEALAKLCKGRSKHPDVTVIVTLGRDVFEQSVDSKTVDLLESFGVQFINDTCWCMIEEPIIPTDASILMTNSGKYAHYGPGLVNRPLHFGSLAQCVDAACCGKRLLSTPEWES